MKKQLINQEILNAVQQNIILRTEFQELSTEALIDILDLIEESISHYLLLELHAVARNKGEFNDKRSK